MAAPATNDPVVKTLADQIEAGLATIISANEVLLAEEKGTPVREIDKSLKTGAEDGILPKEIASLYKKFVDAQTKARELQAQVRNSYRTEILGEDAQDDAGDSEKDELKAQTKETRSVIMDTLSFLVTYSTQNGINDVAEWAKSLEVPQVGRKATSTAGGTGSKKPRVYVKVDGEVHESFTKAALAISSKDRKFSAGELAEAWENANGAEPGTFEFEGHTFEVTPKTKDNSAG